MQQNEAGNPVDKFFMRDKGKRAIFRQILAGDPLEAQVVHFKLKKTKNEYEPKKPPKPAPGQRGDPYPKTVPASSPYLGPGAPSQWSQTCPYQA